MEFVINAVCAIVATRLNRASITIDEVDKIYESGNYPEINAEIDYILGK